MDNLNRFPQTPQPIPDYYFDQAENKGKLENIYYETYESFSYEEKTRKLTKRRVVYLPYGYDEKEKYPVFYLMHGGWSNETTYLGTPEKPEYLKNILDNGIAEGKIKPMIVVCPTYNNTSGQDSSDYGLALQLTNNYRNELINDLIPAVESSYSTYARDTTPEGIARSRDYRAFCGFSMGSVTTWRTFQYCLDYFRYFMPSSGSFTSDADFMVDIVKSHNKKWNDFFIYGASGTKDFAYSSFKQQIDNMAAEGDTFRFADNESEGNLYYMEQEGGDHSHRYAVLYIYNGLIWIWK